MTSCDLDRIFTPSTSQEHRFAIAVPTLIERDTKPIEKNVHKAKAMILNSLNQVRSIVINSIAGTEKAIVFLGKTFVVDKAYNSLNEAIAGCRKDLDLGMAILIAPEANLFKVWIAIPNELIWQAA
ncbi:MAG: hypothetical protein WCQ26_00950 [Pseudanabaena sp. ELA748]